MKEGGNLHYFKVMAGLACRTDDSVVKHKPVGVKKKWFLLQFEIALAGRAPVAADLLPPIS